MEYETTIKLADFDKKVFDVKNDSFSMGAWWWWFWLFFFDNPDNPKKPRQLMILWSTKNTKRIDCNDLKIKFDKPFNKENLDGVIAAWYFDGEKMHHNFLLEQCDIKLEKNALSTKSKIPTLFTADKKRSTVKIGDNFEFNTDMLEDVEFSMPTIDSNMFLGDKGYSIIRSNKMSLHGKVNDKEITGSAYFQRVFVTAPSPSWFWGIFHFERGGILTYFNPHIFGKNIKKDVKFFDGKNVHVFKEMKSKRIEGKLPFFEISCENDYANMSFTVESYSHSWWTFKKQSLKIIPNKLVYNEYPAIISDFLFENKESGEKLTLKDLGKSVGNAEHSTGFLF